MKELPVSRQPQHEQGDPTALRAVGQQETPPARSALDPERAVSAASVALKSLAPMYNEAQHGAYLQRLELAVKDLKNRNIAITGRYGAGKSSVLDQFQERHPKGTLRLAISTLGPDPGSATLTNRIQKELVKQLLYGASSGTLRHSRFARITPLSRWRALAEASGTVLVILPILALLGWLPTLAGAGADANAVHKIGIWFLFGSLVTLLMTAVRLLTYERFFIANLGAAGASVTLSERTSTYFDEYLEEIVHFFDEESPDLVIFEDLDRFDDPQIFEALRELNTLLNSTPKRIAKQKPLRFIYAVRDSLFEQLGADTREGNGDAAAAETIRANRTKFFDIVIPLVPFISHRNARELLTALVTDAGITGIERRLIEIVAQHTTDMRLLLNMRNEYLVFAERLLESGNPAPGLTASNLFALVAYKNFHLEDFEQISRRSSDLDHLYDKRRQLVRSAVARLEKQKRELLAKRVSARTMTPTAERLGNRLVMHAQLAQKMSPYGGTHLRYEVDSEVFKEQDVTSYAFWIAVAQAQQIAIWLSNNPDSGGQKVVHLGRGELARLLPESLEAGHWQGVDEATDHDRLSQIENDIAFLRGADFQDLSADDRFRVADEDEGDGEVTFAELTDCTLRSDLARQLVHRGHLDRNFALYAAQFYGHFTGVDVATFIVQSVQTNTMDIDYQFTSPGAVNNLLQEAGEDFTRTVSAYNVEVLDRLLTTGDARAANVVDHMLSRFAEAAHEFLTAYFTSGEQRSEFAALLSARGWRGVFSYLNSEDAVPDDVRPLLVSAALREADPERVYELASLAAFVADRYREIPVFTEPQDEAVHRMVVNLLAAAGTNMTSLEGTDASLRALLVERNLYRINAANLRVALGGDGDVSLDRMSESDAVRRYCLAEPAAYLSAVSEDPNTAYAVHTAETLTAVLGEVADSWEPNGIQQLIGSTDRAATLPNVAEVPCNVWQPLATAGLFAATLTNLQAYRAALGSIDEPLAQVLLQAGRIDVEVADGDAAAKLDAAVAILNARLVLPDPGKRVELVVSLDLDAYVPAVDLAPEGGDLFAMLLAHDLVEDKEETFSHYRAAGWAGFEPAINASQHIQEFVTPDLLEGMVAEIFASPQAAAKLGRLILTSLEEYVVDDDSPALTAAANFAYVSGVALPLDQIRRVAAAGRSMVDVTLCLLQGASPVPSADDVAATLSALGEPYNNLTTRAKTEFDVPADDGHRHALQILKQAGRCTFRQRRVKRSFSVKLT